MRNVRNSWLSEMRILVFGTVYVRHCLRNLPLEIINVSKRLDQHRDLPALNNKEALLFGVRFAFHNYLYGELHDLI